MKLLIRALVLTRYLTLNRQAREIRRIVQALPVTAQRAVGQLAMAEIQNASKEPVPHLYGSENVDRYQPWSETATQSFGKARSRVPQLKLRGIAMWLAVVYHETRDSQHTSLLEIHREVLGLLGLLKGTYAAGATTEIAGMA